MGYVIGVIVKPFVIVVNNGMQLGAAPTVPGPRVCWLLRGTERVRAAQARRSETHGDAPAQMSPLWKPTLEAHPSRTGLPGSAPAPPPCIRSAHLTAAGKLRSLEGSPASCDSGITAFCHLISNVLNTIVSYILSLFGFG